MATTTAATAVAAAVAWPESPTPQLSSLPPPEPHGLRLVTARVRWFPLSRTYSLVWCLSIPCSFAGWNYVANSFALIWLHVHAYAFAHRCVIYWIFLSKYFETCQIREQFYFRWKRIFVKTQHELIFFLHWTWTTKKRLTIIRYDLDFVLLKIHWQINVVSWQMQTNRMNPFEMWNLGQTAQLNAYTTTWNVKISKKTHEHKNQRRKNYRRSHTFSIENEKNSIAWDKRIRLKEIVGLSVLFCFSLFAQSLATHKLIHY